MWDNGPIYKRKQALPFFSKKLEEKKKKKGGTSCLHVNKQCRQKPILLRQFQIVDLVISLRVIS